MKTDNISFDYFWIILAVFVLGVFAIGLGLNVLLCQKCTETNETLTPEEPLIVEEFTLFSPVGKVLEEDVQPDDPCQGFQDYIDNPKECFLHYLVGRPDALPYEVVIYLAPDGDVRWMKWEKEGGQK